MFTGQRAVATSRRAAAGELQSHTAAGTGARAAGQLRHQEPVLRPLVRQGRVRATHERTGRQGRVSDVVVC